MKYRAFSLVAVNITLEKLVELGNDPNKCARPHRRVILQKGEDVLSDALLGGTFSDGDVIYVDYCEDEVVLHRQTEQQPEAEGA